MRKYAHVLHTLNGGQSSVELFIHHSHLILGKDRLGSSRDCIDCSSGHGQISLERIEHFFNRLQMAYAEEHAIIERVFPSPDLVVPKFLEQIGQVVLSPYLTSLIDEARNRGLEMYLKTVYATFVQTHKTSFETFLKQKHSKKTT
jgi:recyclin-1